MYLTAEDKAFFEAEAVKVGVSDPHLSVKRSSDYEKKIQLLSGKDCVATGFLSHFPGCCGIAILHSAGATNDDDGRKLALMFRIREAMAREGNKGLLVYTDVVGAEPGFLRKLGYRTATRGFFNPNSGNDVTVWVKRIHQDER